MYLYPLLVLSCGVATPYLFCCAFAPIAVLHAVPSLVRFDRPTQLFAKPQRLAENVEGVVYVNDRVSRTL
jgi:hypothetical protein